MFDTSNIDIVRLGIEAACQQAYEAGARDACGPAHAGMHLGYHAAMAEIASAATPVRAWFNGDHTIMLFEDGKKEKVTWRHEAGSDYDCEKAVMACMLKHVFGNAYIKVLREFCAAAPVRNNNACSFDEFCQHANDGGMRIPQLPPVDCDGGELCVPSLEPVDCDGGDTRVPAPAPVDCDEAYDEALCQELLAMDDEPGFGPDVFQG